MNLCKLTLKMIRSCMRINQIFFFKFNTSKARCLSLIEAVHHHILSTYCSSCSSTSVLKSLSWSTFFSPQHHNLGLGFCSEMRDGSLKVKAMPVKTEGEGYQSGSFLVILWMSSSQHFCPTRHLVSVIPTFPGNISKGLEQVQRLSR